MQKGVSSIYFISFLIILVSWKHARKQPFQKEKKIDKQNRFVSMTYERKELKYTEQS